MDDAERTRLDEKYKGTKPDFTNPEYQRWAASQKKRPSGKALKDETEKKIREGIEASKVTVEELLAGLYDDPEDVPVEMRMLAQQAVDGGVQEMKLLLQQAEKLRGAPPKAEVKQLDGVCPECKAILGHGPETLVLSDRATEGLASARNMALEAALSEHDPEHPLLAGQVS